MEIAGALATLTALGELTKNVVRGKVDAEVKAKASELADSIIGLQTTIFSIQSQNHELLEKNRELKESINQLDLWEKTSERYLLVEICSGVFLYSLKPELNDEPHHHICPNCFSGRRKSILVKGPKRISGTKYSCVTSECQAQYMDYVSKAAFKQGRTTGLY